MRWILVALVVVMASVALAADPDARGWLPGAPAARTAEALTPSTPMVVELPEPVARAVTAPTFLFYFAPECPHCQQAIAEVIALSRELGDRLSFLAVSSGGSTPDAMEAFRLAYQVPFPVIYDTDRDFARVVGARSTPMVLLITPTQEGFEVRDAYMPWFRGAGAVFKMRLDPSQPFGAFLPGVFQGEQVCAQCHALESRSLQLTHHALAYRTLYTRDRARDLQCVGCHVTGLGDATGFQVGDHASPFVDVTCEACHSAGGPHDGERVDARDSCVTCHDAKHSIAFEVEKGLPHIDHFLADHLDEESLKARWLALRDGEAPRPLLAFPEGEHVGSGACRSCHAAEYKSWKRSPHRKAMGSLGAGEADEVDCVRCHASPVASGPEPQELSGFLRAEGVGCESCHGPGQAHLDDPGKDTILGLGESCAECVIEEVCTTCHTSSWDPGWELRQRLDATRH